MDHVITASLVIVLALLSAFSRRTHLSRPTLVALIVASLAMIASTLFREKSPILTLVFLGVSVTTAVVLMVRDELRRRDKGT